MTSFKKQVLLILHPDVLDAESEDRAQAHRQWRGAFEEGLRSQGWEVVRLKPAVAGVRVADYALVHCFSGIESETWAALKNSGKRVVVTPSLDPKPEQDQQARAQLLKSPGAWLTRGARAIKQRAWPSKDERIFLSCADGYLVPSKDWGNLVRAGWKSRGRIRTFDASPEQTAREAAALYQEILTQP